MQIVHIITGLNDGGAEAVLYRLCKHELSNTHTVISLMDGGKYGRLLTHAGVVVHCLNMQRGKLSVRGAWKLWQLLRTIQPDVVQTWMYHADFVGGVVARLSGVRAVCWGIRHSTLEPGESKRSTIWVARACAVISRIVPQYIVCCAQKAAEIHADLGYARKRMVVVPNGFDSQKFKPNKSARNQLRAQWGIDEDTLIFGMVGRLDKQKDHGNLIKALDELSKHTTNFRCVLVGRGLVADNPALPKTDTVQDKLILLGPREDIPAVMNALDIHVLSSAHGEAFPNVIAEAMASGTPCVTTDVGDAAVIVGNIGWVVHPRDSNALGRALVNASVAYSDRPAWARRKAMARRRITENFSIIRMLEGYQVVWKQAFECK